VHVSTKHKDGKAYRCNENHIQVHALLGFPEKCLIFKTRNSLVDEIGERYRMNHAIVVKLLLISFLLITIYGSSMQ